MFGKRPRHHDLPDVMHQPRHVIRVIRRPRHGGRNLPRQQGRADAVLPELAPGKGALARQPLKILDHRRHHRQLADLPHAQIEHGFLDAVDRRGQTEIDRIHQPQQPGCKAGIAPDDLCDLGRIALLRKQQILQRLVDAAERRDRWTPRKLRLNVAPTQSRHFLCCHRLLHCQNRKINQALIGEI